MEINELRSGNWIDTKDFHFDKFKGLYQYDPEWHKYVHIFDPILLTEEWLLKFGFTKDREYSDYYTKEGFFDVWFNKEKGLYTIGHYDMDNVDIADVKYAHELQNAYYVIKKEELTLK